jgi:hypothetical protein
MASVLCVMPGVTSSTTPLLVLEKMPLLKKQPPSKQANVHTGQQLPAQHLCTSNICTKVTTSGTQMGKTMPLSDFSWHGVERCDREGSTGGMRKNFSASMASRSHQVTQQE